MVEHTVFLFPGHGSYAPGALHGLVDETMASTLARLDGVVVEHGYDPVSCLLTETDSPSSAQLVTDDPGRLQLAIYATSLCLAGLLDTRYGIRPDLVFGHSFGDFAAFAAAGFFTPEEGMRAACIRATELRRAEIPDGGMLAVALNATRLRHLVAALDEPGLAVAAENAPHETVASGTVEALRALERVTLALGVRTTWLRVPYPVHSPLLAGPRQTLAEALGSIPVRYPTTRCWSDVLGRYLTDADDIPELLARHLVEPVRFLDGVRALHADGGTRFVECGARDVLTRLASACLPPVTALAPLRKRTTFDELRTLLGVTGSPEARVPAAAPTAHPVASLSAVVIPAPAVDTARVFDPFPELAAPNVVATNGASAPAPAPRPTHTAQEQLAELRHLYAEAMEYPESVVTADAEFEADLGIDSLKQNELLAEALVRYELTDRVPELRATQYPTLNAVVDFLQSLDSVTVDE